jgi:DNA repair protein RadD
MSITLRPYQEAALTEARKHIRQGRRRVLIVAPTGSGKTSVAGAMIQSAFSRGKESLFLAHRKELLEQCHERLGEFGVDASIVRSTDQRIDLQKPVQVASVQTLARRLDRFATDAFDLVIVDEAHHGRAATYEKILAHFSGAKAIVGLTATPCRKDGRGLASSFDAIVETATIRGLIDQKFLVPIRMWSVPEIDLAGVRTNQGDYALNELGDRMNTSSLVGNIVAEWKRLAHDRQTVIFATTVEHSQSIRDRFLEAGIRAEHVDGKIPDYEREAILRRVRSGETQVVTNCQILTEGWDEPGISACVLARPTKSLSLYLQMAGRILRPAPGKADALILDHANNLVTHGVVDCNRKWKLTNDKRVIASRGDAPQKVCPQCGAVQPAATRECPECGCAFERERFDTERDGQLAEVKANGSIQKSRGQQRKAFLELVSQVRTARRQNGQPYKLTAAAVKYHEKFGEWPPWKWQREAGIQWGA